MTADHHKLSLKMQDGKPEMPVVVLIHGLGMNNDFWIDPEKCFVLGGLAPLTVFLSDLPEKGEKTISFGRMAPHMQGLWHSLQAAGFSLASWSQSQPLGPVQIALAELKSVLGAVAAKWPGKPVFLIGHSRGGIIARRYLLDEGTDGIGGLITICTPHAGSGMAKFSPYLKPAGSLLEKILPRNARTSLTRALNRLAGFLQSPAIAELRPESEFMATLQGKLPKKICRLSFGGTSPALFQLIVRLPAGKQRTIKFPDLLTGIIPGGHLPRELTPGAGDALVSAASARLPGARHYDFPVNHVRAAFDGKVHEIILAFLYQKTPC